MRDTIAGSAGIAGIVVAALVASLVISIITGDWFYLILSGLGVFVGLQAAKIINRT